jgi:hypothetical protein
MGIAYVAMLIALYVGNRPHLPLWAGYPYSRWVLPSAIGAPSAARALDRARGTTHEDVPDWWPYAAEFPHWHVWQGVCGLVYARRPRSSPPVVVRGEDAVDLRNQMRQAEGRMTSFKGSNPGAAD